jgi:putative hydrolase of the HAD superfamily
MMMHGAKVQVPWAEIDTLLLDMDGTLLDLAFDNFFWHELVPGEYARSRGLAAAKAEAFVRARYAAVIGTLPWYCIDHWTAELGLDLEGLKHAHRHRIRYLPGAERFLELAQASGKRLILVTNAHRVTLAIKCEQTRVDRYMHAVVSSHDYGREKESLDFWQRLEREHGFLRERTLLIEDSLAVLGTAREFGIGHTIAIACPDSTRGARQIADFNAVNGVADLIG